MDAYSVKASTGVKFGGCGKYLKTMINTNEDKKSNKFVLRLLYLKLIKIHFPHHQRMKFPAYYNFYLLHNLDLKH